MPQLKMIRCIHTDKKTGKTKVVHLSEAVVNRGNFMKNYGYRVEEVPTAPVSKEPKTIKEQQDEALKETPVITGDATEEVPVFEIQSADEQAAVKPEPEAPVKAPKKPGRKPATNKK